MTQADLLTREQVLEHLKTLVLAYGIVGDHSSFAPAVNALSLHDSAQRSALPPAMTWTTQKPTKPGWYWRRNDSWPKGYITEIDQLDINGMVKKGWFAGGDWAGPIEPPQ